VPLRSSGNRSDAALAALTALAAIAVLDALLFLVVQGVVIVAVVLAVVAFMVIIVHVTGILAPLTGTGVVVFGARPGAPGAVAVHHPMHQAVIGVVASCGSISGPRATARAGRMSVPRSN
jgi:hypothetical protein